MTPAETLARLVIRTLDAQQAHFRTKQGLDACKQLERQLRTAAITTGGALGELALRTLDRQREFYASRDRQQLLEAKAAERRLRTAATHVLHPVNVQPSLFGD